MDLFTYLMAKKGQNTQRDLFSYLLGKGAGGSGTYVNFTGTSLNISNTLKARIKNITLKGATSQDGTPTPEAPIPIKVVTGEQNVTVSSRNVFDGELELGNINQWGNVSSNSIIRSKNYIKIKSSNTYNFSSSKTIILNNIQIFFYDENRIFITSNWLYTNRSYFTTPENAKYLRFKINDDTDVSQLIQIEEGTAATTYTPYYSKDYPLSLGTLELAEITENYQDYIYGSPNNWYKYKYVDKVVLDGTEAWTNMGWSTSLGYAFRVPIDGIKQTTGGTEAPNCMSNYYRAYTYSNLQSPNIKYGLANRNSYAQIVIRNDDCTTATELKTWLSTHNTTVYYVLATPTTEQITDTTLIEQLNNLYNATSQDGTTIITCSSASDSNEIIVFSGDIKVASVGNSLNTSLLSSNIQEEPNLDDVNETEDIEQNEEPIEEEVS